LALASKTQKGSAVSGLIGSIVGGILNALIGWFDKWLTGKQLVEAQTEAAAKKEALESVAEARQFEEVARRVADVNEPPVSPKIGDKWLDPKTNVPMVWDGAAFVKESDYNKDEGDFFMDNRWNRRS
jgi:hypothetical protein